MRTTTLPLALLLGAAATAATVSGGERPWTLGSASNLDVDEGHLALTTAQTEVGEWIRHPYDGENWEAQASKDDAGLFSAADLCLASDANLEIAEASSTVLGGTAYRTGPQQTVVAGVSYVSTLPDSALVPLPDTLGYVPEIRFLTAGAHGVGDAAYTVTFYYEGGAASVGPVPIRNDLYSDVERDDEGSLWQVLAFEGVHTTSDEWVDADGSGSSDCVEDARWADEVYVLNPRPSQAVTAIEIGYDDFDGGSDSWLGGPFALSAVTDEADLDATFGFQGTWTSPSNIAAGEALDGGPDALWQQLDFDAHIPSGSEIRVHFACGDDDDGDGVLELEELEPTQSAHLSSVVGPWALPVPCHGQFAEVQVDLVDGGVFDSTAGIDDIATPLQLRDIRFVVAPDVDMDGFDNTVDCDDNNPDAYPYAPEIIGNDVDEDCDTQETCYDDNDNDNDRHETNTRLSTNLNCNQANEAYPAAPIDCDDTDQNRNSGATEIVSDGIDQDCDLRDDCYQDIDQDTYGDNGVVVTSLGATCLTANQEAIEQFTFDCDDNDALRSPGLSETTGDGKDNNCDNFEDCYEDDDDDGFRHATNIRVSGPGDHDCDDTFEALSSALVDCDDTDPLVFPTGSEVTGNNVDENCDGTVECWQDADNDGARSDTLTITTIPGDTDCTGNFEGHNSDDIDCDELDATVNPAATEIVGNNVDENCNGSARCYDDDDDDGDRDTSTHTGNGDTDCMDANEGLSGDPLDCDDNDSSRNSGATEGAGDNVDQDCDNRELCYFDVDNDGARTTGTFLTSLFDTNCTQANEGEFTDDIDCNDIDGAILPGVAEIPGDNVDQNCDNIEDCYFDVDDDGARTSGTNIGGNNNDADCDDPFEGRFGDDIDCDDIDPAIRPGVAEVAGDNVDQNCDGVELCFQDDDDDGDRDTTTTNGNGDADCNDPNEGVLTDDIDCADQDPSINSGALELPGDNVDQDCDGVELCYQDDDDDGDRDTTTHTGNGDADCNDPNEGRDFDVVDCADQDSTRASTNTETVGNEVDNDCDLQEICWRDQDNDGDRHDVNTITSTADADCNDTNEARTSDPIDCDDLDATEYNGAPELCDGQDNDCNTVLPGNEIDDDGDDYVECTWDAGGWDGDPAIVGGDDCDDGRSATHPNATDVCGNGIDDNCDGLGNWGAFQNFLDDDDDGLDYNAEQALGTSDCDNDSDGDGLTDDDEVNLTNTDPADSDTDGDNMDDGTEVGGNPNSPVNTDGTDNHDALDTDDDNDGVLSIDEDIDGDGNPRNDDEDGDGLRNVWDTDDDGDDVDTIVELVFGDTDGDNTDDWLDPDDDNDGILTRNEDVVIVNNNPTDDHSDSDGIPDYRDDDDDDDTVDTIDEDIDGVGTAINDNTDGDLLPNYRDTDDDNDTLLTIDEVADAGGTPDRDGDGDDNYLDIDSDDDTYLDSEERRINTDGDANLDYLDLDSDDDTVQDINEVREDYDSDGDDNRVDDDDDGDGILTEQEESDANGGDGDGFPNYRDLDSDGDNWDDAYEWTVFTGSRDTDGDGRNNYIDIDSDDDSIDDDDELGSMGSPVDSDLDGDENRIDNDDDGDSLLTIDEDVDGDGDPRNDNWDGTDEVDYLDTDDDNDNVPTIFEGPNTPLDTDGDGNFDYHDTDDDNDTIPTIGEDVNLNGNPRDDDTDTDGIPNYLDNDDDNDTIPTTTEIVACGGPDTDGDGTPNARDTDSDDDGFDDQEEWTSGATTDYDGDGCDDYVDQDSDDDSILDIDELHTNTDGQLGENRIDEDDDGDSLLTINELSADSDSDGTTNYLDSDDDGDNVQTIDEIGNPNPGSHADFDGDSTVNYLDTDDDNDGEDTRDEDPDNDGNPHDDDTDGDGSKNYLDTDDDDDLILTIIENNEPPGRNPDGDTLASGLPNDNHLDLDSDGDGFTDVQETNGVGGLIHTDSDGVADFLDTDSDDDSVPDDREGTFSGTEVDTDGDGAIDRVDTDDDDDLIPTFEECTINCSGTWPLPCICITSRWNSDWEGDGTPDYLDPDDDNDQVLTREEDVDTNGDPRNDNTDSLFTSAFSSPDALADWLDDDDDGDGLLTIEEDLWVVDGNPLTDDTDGDGTPNFREEDDDGDGILTAIETEFFDTAQGSNDPRDYDLPDLDGLPNFLDEDDDNDRVDTLCEYGYGIDHLAPDVDGDTVLDGDEWFNFVYLDLFLIQGEAVDYLDDNGGITGDSCTNPWDRDSDGVINALDTDDDADGMFTGQEEIGTDLDCQAGTAVLGPDGIPDYLDRDSDNDGLLDDRFGDGISSDGLGDLDFDGIPDFLDCDDSGPGGDSDEDGVTNGDEETYCPYDPLAPFPNWCAIDPDIDKDGVVDGVEVDVGGVLNPLDTDGDGTPDFLDTDDDADTFPSVIENQIYCGAGEPLAPIFDQLNMYWTFECRDDYGLMVSYDFGSNDLDDYPNTDAPTGGPFPLNPDSIPDFRDADDDGDGTDSVVEGTGDLDGDGVVNYLDPYDHDGPDGDPDGDGLTTAEEAAIDPGLDPYDDDTDGDGISDGDEIGDPDNPTDSDGDGLIDAVDDDDDNDGIPTIVEGTSDADGDGVPNYLDDDSDGDGIADSDEVGPGGEPTDVDCDGVFDFLDANHEDGPCRKDTGRFVADEYSRQDCSCSSSSPASLAWLPLLALGLVGLRRRRAS